MDIDVDVEGLDEALAKVGPELYAKPLRDFFKKCGIYVSDRAKEKAPRDTSRLAASYTYVVDTGEPPQQVEIGTNVEYAKPVEFGTGLFSDAPDSKHARHWPPAAALDVWAARHGFSSGAQVAAIIGKRGGLKPKRPLRDAFEESREAVNGFLSAMRDDIANKWSAP